MMRIEPIHLLAGLLALIIAAALVLTLEGSYQHQHTERSEEFQRLIGGLGFGPSLDLSHGEFRFDPRLADHPTHDAGPLPGAARFDPERGRSIFYYPPMKRQTRMPPRD
jgi:hypothetical protein